MLKNILTFVCILSLAAGFAFASDKCTDLNGTHSDDYGSVPGGNYLLPDDWLNPCGDNSGEGDTWYNGLLWNPGYTSEWPSFNGSMANFMDLDSHYGIGWEECTIDECEVGCMNHTEWNDPVDLFVVAESGGYPDAVDGDDALAAMEDVDTSGWTSGTYPNMAWNSVDLDPDFEGMPNVFFFGLHEHWSGTADFYLAFQSEANGALDVGWLHMDSWQTIPEYGYAPSAWALKLHAYEHAPAIQDTSLGTIKSMF